MSLDRQPAHAIPPADSRVRLRCLRSVAHTAAVLGVLGAVSCAPSRDEHEVSAGAPPVATAPRAEARTTTGMFRLQVLEVRRIGEAVLEARFGLTNLQSSGEPVAVTNQFARSNEDVGSIADVYLADEPGHRKYFVLRDARHRPECSTQIAPLAPGETRTLWARFLAPPVGVVRIGVQFPQIAGLLDVPIEAPAEPGTGSPRL